MMDALSFVKFSELQNWSVLYLTTKAIGYNRNYTLFPIGSFLHHSDDTVVIMDEEKYIQVTVHTNNGGIEARDAIPKLGKDIGTKRQYRIHEGQFLMSKIDARNGAFGIVPSDLENAIVTQDFPVFNVDSSKLNSEYLLLVTTTEHFKKVAQDCSSGTTNRQRIDIKKFLAQRIPLPLKSQQDEIVSKYKHAILEAGTKEAQAEQLSGEIEKFLNDELGIEQIQSKVTKKNHGLQIIRFTDVNRWDYEYFTKDNAFQSKYKLVPFESVLCPIVGNTTKIQEHEIQNSGIYPVVTQEKKRLIAGYTDRDDVINDLPLVIFGDHSCAFKYVDFSFVRGADGTKLLKFDKRCNPKFYAFFLSTIKIDNSEKYQRHYKYLTQTKIPLPPIDIQNSIVSHVTAIKSQIELLGQQATYLRKKALKDFEKEIFE